MESKKKSVEKQKQKEAEESKRQRKKAKGSGRKPRQLVMVRKKDDISKGRWMDEDTGFDREYNRRSGLVEGNCGKMGVGGLKVLKQAYEGFRGQQR